MRLSNLTGGVLALLLLLTALPAQQAGTMRTPKAPVVRSLVAMRHAGATPRPATTSAVRAVPASFGKARTFKTLSVHFRH